MIAPFLPAPPSWYPGHMTQFARLLPQLLQRTDVVLELRDARLPLTSINRTFEGTALLPLFDISRLPEVLPREHTTNYLRSSYTVVLRLPAGFEFSTATRLTRRSRLFIWLLEVPCIVTVR